MASASRGVKYHALPTSEDVADSEVNADVTRDPPLSVPWDGRIGWAYFFLGCAMLLPWNGVWHTVQSEFSFSLGGTQHLSTQPLSSYLDSSVVPCERRSVPIRRARSQSLVYSPTHTSR